MGQTCRKRRSTNGLGVRALRTLLNDGMHLIVVRLLLLRVVLRTLVPDGKLFVILVNSVHSGLNDPPSLVTTCRSLWSSVIFVLTNRLA